MEWTLENYVILKTLKQNPGITRYRLYQKVKRQLRQVYISQLYMLMRRLEKDGDVTSRIDRAKKETFKKRRPFWISMKGKLVELYYITPKGEQTLKDLENKIEMMLI